MRKDAIKAFGLLWLALTACGPGEAPRESSTQVGDDDDVPRQEKWTGEVGRWRRARTDDTSELTPEQQAEIERLAALGYAAGVTEAGVLAGVTRHDEERSFGGLNFYASGHAPVGILMDMGGRELHRWELAFEDAWPDAPAEDRVVAGFWRRAYLYPNGDVLAIFEGLGLVKLDRDSRLLWANPLRAHHQATVLPDGTIYVLSREPHLVPRINADVPLLEDFVSVLDAEGRELRRVSVLECLEKTEYFARWEKRIRRGQDVFHTNALELLDGRLAGRIPGFRAGNVLLSMRRLHAIGVVDLERETFVWMHTGSFRRQHDPRVLTNGNLLVFDNNEREAGSSVQELDPTTGELRWVYRGSEEAPFYSNSCGTAQRLENGNTLITETDNGRAFEVTPGHEIVWEFHNPHRAGDENQYVASLFEVVRLPPDFGADWIDRE